MMDAVVRPHCGAGNYSVEDDNWTDIMKGLGIALLVQLDPYDPRKPEYIIPMTPEQQEEESWSTTLRQILRLESALAKRRSGEEECCPEIMTHYESILEELKCSAEAVHCKMKQRGKPQKQATELTVPMESYGCTPSKTSIEDTKYLRSDTCCTTLEATGNLLHSHLSSEESGSSRTSSWVDFVDSDDEPAALEMPVPKPQGKLFPVTSHVDQVKGMRQRVTASRARQMVKTRPTLRQTAQELHPQQESSTWKPQWCQWCPTLEKTSHKWHPQHESDVFEI